MLLSPVRGLMSDYPLNIATILRRAETYFFDQEIVSVTLTGELSTTTYGATFKRIRKLANALKRMGIKPGDRVGTFAWNTIEHFELYYAVPCIGSVLHTINIRLSASQLTYVINHAEDQVLFVDASLLPLIERSVSQWKSVKQFIVMGGSNYDLALLPNAISYEDLIASENDDCHWPDIDEWSAAGLCYTSGTTGNPKGVLYSHRSQVLHTVSSSMGDNLPIQGNDTALFLVPLFHANGWGWPYICTVVGARIVLPGHRLKPQQIAWLIQEAKVTYGGGVPTLWQGLVDELKIGKYDLKTLRVAFVGGSAAPRILIESYHKNGIAMPQGWGMTETSPSGSNSEPLISQFNEENLGLEEICDFRERQGIPRFGLEIRIVDATGNPLPWDDRAEGELQVRGCYVASGYYNDDSSKSNFHEEGWFSTGDLASISPNGSLWIVDRIKDLVKSGGEWISSVDLENELLSHPFIKEAAVIAVPDGKWSERPVALLVLRDQSCPTRVELERLLIKKFVKFWIPDRFIAVESLPKGSTGKIDKKLLRSMYANEKFNHNPNF